MTENRRAIDTDELLQIIDASEGIYLSTLVNILQCNRINLSKRLKILEKNKFIKSIKADKTIYYTKKYDFKNVKSLENQSKLINSLGNMVTIYYSSIAVQTSHQKEKNLVLNMVVNSKNWKRTFEINKDAFDKRDSLFKKESDKNDYWNHLLAEAIQMNFRLTYINNENIADYTTGNYDYTDILAISDDNLIQKIKSRLQPKNYNTGRKDRIRNDILIYNFKTNEWSFFIADKSYTITYSQCTFNDVFYLIQYFFLTDNDKTTITLTKEDKTFKNWIYLYQKSKTNKKRYNTVNIRLENKNRKTLDSK
ncbi:hypothetical protein [Enterococcus faecium]|uniref:hypothetical protein n=1 Tax=Enterococcus TaxID=1350 RepID=UPI00287F9374|nr:hypothetical protein [Enterococcus faecium]